jgi:hypothetical protein
LKIQVDAIRLKLTLKHLQRTLYDCYWLDFDESDNQKSRVQLGKRQNVINDSLLVLGAKCDGLCGIN